MWTKLWKRLMNVIKANANEGINNLEDPVKMIKLAIEEMGLAIGKSTEALSKAIANQRQLQKKTEELTAQSNDWYQKATFAVKSNQDELAKKALERKSIIDGQLEQYTKMSKDAQVTCENLTAQLDRMKIKFEEAKAKESILIAKAESSKAQIEIAEQLGGINSSALGDFSRFEEKINKMEAEAEAKTELTNATSKLDREFETLESGSRVFNDLDAIRTKLVEEEKEKRRIEEEKQAKKLEQHFSTNSNPVSNPKVSETPKVVDAQKQFEQINKQIDVDQKFKDFFKDSK